MRYEHFLTAARPSPWPKGVICLSCDVEWSSWHGEDKREYAALAAWHVALCTPRDGVYSVARTASGATADGFWRMLTEASARCNDLWIVSSCFRAEATVLGLWERMESGHVRTSGKDHRAGAHNRNPVRDLRSEGDSETQRSPAEMGGSDMPVLPSVSAKSSGRKQCGRGRKGSDRSGVCVLEDPPVIIQLRLPDSSGKLTWVDAANYGISQTPDKPPGVTGSTDLARWFIRAASTLKSLASCGWQATAGSQAMHLFRSGYLETPILSHTHPGVTALESGAIFGGRCECFQLGRIAGNAHLLDIRSMYPYLCAHARVPVRLVGVELAPTVQSLCTEDESTFAIAEVDIEADEPDYPYRRAHDVIYPVGRYSTCLAGAELQHALQAGVVRNVRHAAMYETELALARYATELYRLRCTFDTQGRQMESAWIKRLMVALPGKFAQRLSTWEDIPLAECPWEWGEWYRLSESGEPERWRVIAGRIQRETKGGYSYGAIPAISAAVCAAGRDRLRRIIVAAGRESVLYCDTDAVIVDDFGLESLTLAGWVRHGEWGYLQPVASSDDTEIFGVKHYRIGGRSRQAGLQVSRGERAESDRGVPSQPWIGWSLRHQLAPADWRESHPYVRGPGRYDQLRAPGGRVRPIEIMEW